MEYEGHGGECCGYGHIYGFDNATTGDFLSCIRQHDENGGEGTNRILEAILSRRQLDTVNWDRSVRQEIREAGGWAALLAGQGFRLAAQWGNSNTGRECYQFLRIPELLTDTEGHRPFFDWEGAVETARAGLPIPPVVREAPVAPPPLIVATEYYAHLQGRGRRGPFETRDAAREAYPRVRRCERRQILSNGTSFWVDV